MFRTVLAAFAAALIFGAATALMVAMTDREAPAPSAGGAR
jgi:hypothetical protein